MDKERGLYGLTMTPMKSPTAANKTYEKLQVSASDQVFFGIVNGLELQKFVPAQRLVEVDLAEQFGVGRNSVREALQRLAAEGMVELHRHKGAVIRSLSMQETLDVLEVAERMTGLLVRAAARGAATSGLKTILSDSLKALKAADAAITAAGGSVTLLPLPFKQGRPPVKGNQFTNR
jgi:DNA-binding GntR family transcriptional regulator